LLTAVIGEALKKVIEKTLFRGAEKAEIEQLFSHLELIAPALAAVGVLILIAGLLEKRQMKIHDGPLTMNQAGWMGIVQGLALPFRGFSRSGSTISAGMLVGAAKERAEEFSFALAVVLTPPVVGLELLRLIRASHAAAATGVAIDLHAALVASLLGMVFSFVAGMIALAWLSRWLESGRWYIFGIYCLVASAVVFTLHLQGF
jgi:undecaprenyl-diphosphatase